MGWRERLRDLWRERLRDLLIAGGSLAWVGCTPGGTCNANPDPCCAAPNGELCHERKVCTAAMEDWELKADPDAGLNIECIPFDGGVAGSK